VGAGDSGSKASCDVIILQLPEPQTGCRSAAGAVLQLYSAADGSTSAAGWRDYDGPFHPNTVELTDLQPNASHRFRLVAYNAAGRSHPGTATEPVRVCARAVTQLSHGAEAEPGQPAAGALVQVWEAIASETASPIALIAGAMVVAICCCARACCGSSNSRAPPGRGGARYERASTNAHEEDDADAEAAEERSGAYDAWGAMLCVHVFVPASTRPIQIEMSTKGATSASALLRQLRLVVSEVAGRQPPLAPEELSVVYEDKAGVQHLVTSRSELHEVYTAARVVASINGARAAPASAETTRL